LITSQEVGVVLRVVDEASPVLQRLVASVREFDTAILKAKESFSSFASTRLAGLIDRLQTVNKSIADVGAVSTDTARVFSDSFLKVDGSITTATDAARGLGAALAEASAAAKTIGVPRLPAAARALGAIAEDEAASGGAGAPPGIRKRGEGGHFGRMGIGPGGVTGGHFSMPSGPVTAAAAAVGYGAYLDAEMEDAIFQIEYHTGEKNTPENNAKYRKIIQDAMSQTGSPLQSVVEATKQEVRMFKGTPGGGVDVLPEMLRAAATEAKLKGTSLEESMTALIGLAHMTKEYSPEQIKKLAPAFAFLSAANPASLGGIESAASYAVPILQSGLEADPMETLLLGTVLTRAGATNTKSGTWLRNMALNAMPGTSLMSKIAFQKHEEALKALGLVDENDKPTWFTDNKPDVIKMLDIASSHAAEIPLEKRAAYEKQLFGAQGFGGFALLADPAVKQQVAALSVEMNSPEFKNRYAGFMQDYNAISPLQMGRTAWADTQNVLMDIGANVLPPVVAGLKGLDAVLKDLDAVLKAFPFLSNFVNGPGLASNAWAAATDLTGGQIGNIGKSLFGGLSSWWGGSPSSGAIAPPLDAGAYERSMRAQEERTRDPEAARGRARMDADQKVSMLPIHVNAVTYLDGNVLARSMSTQLARLSTYPGQAPQGDSYGSWVAPDYQFTTG
jgi:hypothetical protein